MTHPVARGRFDVAIAGGGPAAWMAAVACSDLGLTVALVTAEVEPVWPNTYGVWADDLADCGFEDFAARTFERVVVHGTAERQLSRSYAVVDNAALAARLADRAQRNGVVVIEGRVAGVAHGTLGSTLAVTSPWTAVEAVVAVDATGGGLTGQTVTNGFWQVAYGRVIDASPHLPADTFVMMDGRVPTGTSSADRPPTFLYGFDRGDGTWFVEQTVLTTRNPPDPVSLATGLASRLSDLGITAAPADRNAYVEHVRIPMRVTVPSAGRLVRIGASGGAIHPATGYSFITGLRHGPALARSLSGALERRATPISASDAVWNALWSPAQRRVRSLLSYTHNALARFDQRDFAEFLDVFFALPPDEWSRFLAGPLDGREQSVTSVAATMRHMFAAASPTLRRRLIGGRDRVRPQQPPASRGVE
jgi:lycopene beta-cyclase